MMTLDGARARSAADPLRRFRDRFMLPDGVIYLDGNSLGVLPRAAPPALDDLVRRQWGERLIRSWNEGWIEAPGRIGDKIPRLIGARPGQVIAAHSTPANRVKLRIPAPRRHPPPTPATHQLGTSPPHPPIPATNAG